MTTENEVLTTGRAVGPVRAVDMLELADRTVRACLARITRSTNITHEQWRMLMMLDRSAGADPGEGCTMGEIAGRGGLPAATATRAVDRLVAEGLLVRGVDRWDRRRSLVTITPRGHDLLARAAIEFDEAFGTALSDLGAEDRVDLLGLLQRLTGALGPGGNVSPGRAAPGE